MNTHPSQEAVVETTERIVILYANHSGRESDNRGAFRSDVEKVLTTYAQTIREMERDRIIQIANKEAVSVDDCRNIVVIPKHKFFMAITPITKDNLK